MELEDIKKLANLARIDMSEDEMNGIAFDFKAILAYVGQIQEISNGQDLNEKKQEDYFLSNITREDVVTNNRGEYSEKIMNEMPDKQDGFLKVKQIL